MGEFTSGRFLEVLREELSGKRSAVGTTCLVLWCCRNPRAVVQDLEQPGTLQTKTAGRNDLRFGRPCIGKNRGCSRLRKGIF